MPEVRTLLQSRSSNPVGMYGLKHTKEQTNSAKAPGALLYMGVELELEYIQQSKFSSTFLLESIYETLPGFAIVTTDSSLSNGIEIVSTGATLEFHKGYYSLSPSKDGRRPIRTWVPGVWEEFFKKVAKHFSAFGTNRCGVHIHVGREWISPMTLAKALKFFTKKGNQPFLKQISGRTDFTYAQFERREYTLASVLTGKPATMRGAINTAPKYTIEFRLFNGNAARNGLYRYLEFVDGFLRFCSETSPSLMVPSSLMCWFHHNRTKYPFFYTWLVKEGLWDKGIEIKTRRNISPQNA